MAFRFRLQRILEYRNLLEEQAKEELGRRQLDLTQAGGVLLILNREQADISEIYRRQATGELGLSLLELTGEYWQALNGRAKRQKKIFELAALKADQQREDLRRCWKKRRILEILRQKALLNYHRE